MNDTVKAHVSLLVVAIIYGGNYSIAKVAMDDDHLQPIPFILIRVASAMVLFWFFHAIFIRESIARADLGRFILCGLFGVAINQMFFFKGLDLTTPINASLIMTTTPILVLLTSAALIGERITWRKMLGIALGAFGAGLLIAYGQELNFGSELMLGNSLILVNATSYGIYLVLVKKLMERYQALTVVKWVFSIGLIMVIPFGWRGLMATDWASFGIEIWLSILYVVLATTFVAYLLNALALRVVNPSVVSIYLYLQPLFTTIIALLMEKDQLDMVKVVSGMAIFAGVYLVSRPLAPKPAK